MAAKKHLVPLDMAQNELQNARIQNLASAPGSPVAGQVYYDTVLLGAYVYNGTTWDKAVVVYGTVTAETTYGISSANGAASTASRSDHTHGSPSLSGNTPTTSAVGDSAVVGTGTAPSKDDHKHAREAFGTPTLEQTFGASSANGSAATLARSDHAHGNPVHTAAAHSAIKISDLAVPTAAVAFNAQQITGLADPSLAQDAATKSYVDSVSIGLDVKASVRVATTVAGTLATSFANTSVIDGVTLATGNRILIKNQVAGADNGIYTVNAAGAPTRAIDADASAEVTSGMFTFVEAGTVNASTGWILTTANPITLGTTALVFAQFSGTGLYTATNGVALTGANFAFVPLTNGGLQTASGGASILLPATSGLSTGATGLAIGAGNGITVGATSISVDTAVVARKFSTLLAGASTAYTVTHNLGTLDVIVQVYLVADGSEVVVDNLRATTNTVTINFATAPVTNTYRAVVLG